MFLYPDIAIRYLARYRIKPSIFNIYIECTKSVEIEYHTPYRFLFDIETISSVQRASFWSVLNIVPDIVPDIDAQAGASVPRPPSIDNNEDSEMDFDDQRDYMDQDIPAWKFLTAQFGPTAQFLNGMPDWMNMTPEDIDLAVESIRKDIFFLEYHCKRPNTGKQPPKR
jgi:hypothetical protein